MSGSNRLGTDNIKKLLFELSVPSIVSMIITALYNLVDRYFIGIATGTVGLAGVTVVFPYVLLCLAFLNMISTGATSLISFAIGEKDKERAELILGNTFTMIIIVSGIVTFASLFFLDDVLRLLGASPEVLPVAKQYFEIIVMGTVFLGISFVLSSCMRGEGNAMLSMLPMIVGGVLNVILAPLFIFYFNLGIRGGAYATVLAQIISSILAIYIFSTRKSDLRLHFRHLKPQFKILWNITEIGASQFFLQFGTCFVTVLYNKLLLQYGDQLRVGYGDIALSAMGTVNNIASVVYMPIFGIGQGLQPIIGYNYGAGKYERVKEGLIKAYFFSAVILSVGFIVCEIFPEFIVSLFNNKDTEFIKLATRATRIVFLVYPLIGFQMISSTYFQAVGKPKSATMVSISRQVFALVPAVIIMPLIWGLNGLLFAAPVADLLSTFITAIFIYYEMRHLDAKIKASN